MKYVYKNGIILDGSQEMVPRTGEMIVTDGEKIQAILPQTEEAIKEIECDIGQVIDLEGKYIMPGLINMHVHLPSTGIIVTRCRATEVGCNWHWWRWSR